MLFRSVVRAGRKIFISEPMITAAKTAPVTSVQADRTRALGGVDAADTSLAAKISRQFLQELSKVNAPLQARLAALQSKDDSELQPALQELLQDFPQLARESLQRIKQSNVAKVLAEGMAAAALEGMRT